MKLGTTVWASLGIAPYQFSGPVSSSESDRDKKHPEKVILSEFKENNC